MNARAWVAVITVHMAGPAMADSSVPGAGARAKAAAVERFESSGSYPQLERLEYALYVLYQPLRPDAEHRAAMQLVEEAEAHFRAKRYRAAARGFVAAGQRLLKTRGEPEWELYAADRLLCYANAAVAYDRANALDEARSVLGALSRADPICGARLAQAVKTLPLMEPAFPQEFR